MVDGIHMILHCPECGARHIDEGEFATKNHHTHSCQTCGLTWRPAVSATFGVHFLPGFKNQTPLDALANPRSAYPCVSRSPRGTICRLGLGHAGLHDDGMQECTTTWATCVHCKERPAPGLGSYCDVCYAPYILPAKVDVSHGIPDPRYCMDRHPEFGRCMLIKGHDGRHSAKDSRGSEWSYKLEQCSALHPTEKTIRCDLVAGHQRPQHRYLMSPDMAIEWFDVTQQPPTPISLLTRETSQRECSAFHHGRGLSCTGAAGHEGPHCQKSTDSREWAVWNDHDPGVAPDIHSQPHHTPNPCGVVHPTKPSVTCDRYRAHGGVHRAGTPTHVTDAWDEFGRIHIETEKQRQFAAAERVTEVEKKICDSACAIRAPSQNVGWSVVRCTRVKGHTEIHESGDAAWIKGLGEFFF